MAEFKHCQYRVNDPLENIPYDLTISEFKRYCEPVNPSAFIIAPGGEYRKPTGGCRLIQTIATSRAFNRYRGLYAMPTIDDMVQEAFLGMLLYKDDFTGEPKEVIFKAIRKHFKKLYREVAATARDLDNGRHNARIAPRAKPLKVLIDELDYNPDIEPESVKQANNIKNWRIGGVSKGYRDIIHFYDVVKGNADVFYLINISKYEENEDVRNYNGGEYITVKGEQETTYRRTQIKAAAKSLKLEKEEAFSKKRNNPIELISLIHAGFFPDYKPHKNNKIFLLPGTTGTANSAYQQYIVNHFHQPPQWATDIFSHAGTMEIRGYLLMLYRDIMTLCDTMPEQQRLIMYLYYCGGFIQKDICSRMHISARKVQLAREAGLEEIKQHFNSHYHLTDIVNILERVRKLILNREILPL